MEILGVPTDYWKEIGVAVAILIAAAILGWLVLLVIDKVFTRLARRTRTSFDNAILDAVRGPIFWLIMFLALRQALNQLTFLPETWQETRRDLTFVFNLFVGYLFLYKLTSNLLSWYSREMARRTASRFDEQVLPFARRVVLGLMTIVAGIILLSHFDVDVSALVTTLGIGTLAIALAAQNTLADTINGFALIGDRPFSIGDRIEILELDTWGDVTDIGLRSTRILTRDNRLVVVPNSVIGKSLVVNHSIPSTVYRVQTHLGVDYGADLDHVRQILVDTVRAQDWVMKDRPVEALFIEWGQFAIVFRVRCWIKNYVETRRIMDKLNSCLYDALNEADIEMSYPASTVYHRVDAADRDGLVAVLREARLDA
jgi:small-conductance mechanosensitive channel